MHLFSNNSVCALSTGISDVATTFTTTDPAAAGFAYLAAWTGGHQYATFTDPSDSSAIEIIKIKEHNGGNFTVERGMEGTSPRAWGVGAVLSARITAEMLRSFVQADLDANGMSIRAMPGQGNSISIGGEFAAASTLAYAGLAILAKSRNIERAWIIGGFPVLQASEAENTFYMEDRLSQPAIYGSFSVDLGVPPTWGPSTTYTHGDVVVPTTPDGNQYRLNIQDGSTNSITSSATEPTWGTTSPDDFYTWETVSLAGAVTRMLPMSGVRVYVEEVGFICSAYTASSAPTVSIGTSDDVTAYANAVALSSITGANTRHRILTNFAAGAKGLAFRLDTAASGGVFRGRFYFKGLFVEEVVAAP